MDAMEKVVWTSTFNTLRFLNQDPSPLHNLSFEELAEFEYLCELVAAQANRAWQQKHGGQNG